MSFDLSNEYREPVKFCDECGSEVLENSFGEWMCRNCNNDMTNKEFWDYGEEEGSTEESSPGYSE